MAIAFDVVASVKHLESATYSVGAEPSDWFIVKINMRGNAIEVTLKPERSSERREAMEAADFYCRGLTKIRRGQAPPPEFTGFVLNRTIHALDYLNDGVLNFEVKTPTKSIKTTPILTTRVKKLLTSAYREMTTIDGTLMGIKWSTRKPTFYVEDRLTGNKTRCIFKTEELEKVKDALPKRVEVHGIARFNSLGYPISIDVEDFDVIGSEKELPQLEDLSGVMITDGVLNPTEFVRKLRDGD